MKNKNLYESVLIIKGDLEENEYKKALSKIIERIKKLIDITKVDEVGLKKLAYEIKNYKKGYYVVIYFNTDSQNILELERIYRITDEILKFIVVKRED